MNLIYKSSCSCPSCPAHAPKPHLVNYDYLCANMRAKQVMSVGAYSPSGVGIIFTGLIRGIQMESGCGDSYNVTMLLESGEMKTFHVRVS